MKFISSEYTMIDFLYNINDLRNLVSIFQYGILSKKLVERMKIENYSDISNLDVQKKREVKRVPNHAFLHEYANLYIDARNPMMYFEVRNRNLDELCVICVDKKVLDLENVVITDRNAAAELAKFDTPQLALRHLDFESIFLRNWNDSSECIKSEKKSKKCAEVLVLDKIPVEYLVKIKVATDKGKENVEKLGLGVLVEIDKDMFFQ